MKDHFLAMATLGLGLIAYIVLVQWKSVTGGDEGIGGFSRPEILGSSDETRFYYVVVALTVLIVGFATLLVRSRIGLALMAIREDETGARSLGIPTHLYKVQVFGMAAAMTGIAGSLGAHLIEFVSPEGYDLNASIAMLAAVVIGGLGSLLGAVIGGILVAMLPTVLFAAARHAALAYGVIMALIVLFLPGGIASLLLGGARLLGSRSGKEGGRPAASAVEMRSARQAALAAPPAPGPSLLEVHGLDVRFGGVHAVRDLHLTVRENQIFGLIGPNGAGKTSVFNLITGYVRPQGGRIVFAGTDVTGWSPEQLTRIGLARTFQVARPFTTLSVLDNVLIGRHVRRRALLGEEMLNLPRAAAERRRDRDFALSLLADFGLAHLADVPTGSLPYGHLRLVEVARALATEPRILLLDEPAAGLNDRESDELLEQLVRLRSTGMTILMVEHDMNLVMNVCDEILVMDAGACLAKGDPVSIQSNFQVVEAYLGSGSRT